MWPKTGILFFPTTVDYLDILIDRTVMQFANDY